MARAARPRARPARAHRRPRLRPDDARHRPHARARPAAGARSPATAAAATTARSPTSARACCAGSPGATPTRCRARRSPERRRGCGIAACGGMRRCRRCSPAAAAAAAAAAATARRRVAATPTPRASTAGARRRDDAGEIEALLRRSRAARSSGGDVAGVRQHRDRRAARSRPPCGPARGAALARARRAYVADELETSRRPRAAIAVDDVLPACAASSRPFLTTAPHQRAARRRPAGASARDARAARAAPVGGRRASRRTRARHVVLLTPRASTPARCAAGLERAYRRDPRATSRARDLPRSVLVIAAARRRPGRAADGPDRARRRRARERRGASRGSPPALAVERVLSQRMIVIVSRWSALPECRAPERRSCTR